MKASETNFTSQTVLVAMPTPGVLARLTRLAVPLALSLAISGCGGGDSTASYDGTWDVRYNLSTDECLLVTGGITGFLDQITISQSGQDISVESRSQIFSGSTTLAADDSFTVHTPVTGDVFQNGSSCTGETVLSFSNRRGDIADTLFSQSIRCSDGMKCVSRGLGTGERQPG